MQYKLLLILILTGVVVFVFNWLFSDNLLNRPQSLRPSIIKNISIYLPDFIKLELNKNNLIKENQYFNSGLTNQLDSSSAFQNKASEKRQKNFPTAIIIGAAKCGTTALFHFLKQHPLIATSINLETHYFAKERSLRNNYSDYLDQMEESFDNQTTLEKSPSYLVEKKSPVRILQFQNFLGKKLKFILIVRDPIHRIVSNAYHANNFKEMENLTTSVFRKLETVFNRHSSYGSHFQHWLTMFQRQQILVLDGEQLVDSNPQKVLSKVEKFLNIDRFFETNDFYINQEKGFYCFRPTNFCLSERSGHKFYQQKLTERAINILSNRYSRELELFWSLSGEKFNWSIGIGF